MLGVIGQLLLLSAFAASALSVAAYFAAARAKNTEPLWNALGRVGWGAVTLTTTAAFGLLLYLLFTKQYQYAYVYKHVSNDLGWYYTFSALWEGQEGSFLLWIVYTSFVGGALLIWSSREYEAPLMTVFGLCQAFLVSMIVGLPVGPIELGTTPFSGLAEAFPEAPVFQSNPGYVPPDGQGLNELLKNYWMAIHPPVLFLGFAAMTVPFAYAVSALWKRRYTDWVRRALPWTLFAIAVLGLAIAMGGYWAYETLSFGGYWAWDPVENASLVPWIVGVAALHAMLIQKKSGRGHKAALLLSVLAYMFVVYESFLTRSGILGDVSVHSFVNLGLYNQLLIWMAVIALVGFGLFAWRYRELPTPEHESFALSREFLMFCGVVLLTATATVIIVGTSAPILGQIFRDQPSAVPAQFYDRWTLPLAIGIAFLAGLGQLFWWEKMTVERINRALRVPLALATTSTALVLLAAPFVARTIRPGAGGSPSSPTADAGLLSGLGGTWSVYGQSLLLLLLTFMAFFALYANGAVLWRVVRGNPRMAGGALSHIGFAVLLLGVVGSAGLEDPLQVRGSEGEKRDYFVLMKGEPRTVDGYRMRYEDTERTEAGRTAYRLDVKAPGGETFTLKPVAYKSGEQWFQDPAIKTFFATDLFVSASPREMQSDLESEDEVQGAGGNPPGGQLTMAEGDSTTIGNGAFALEFTEFNPQVSSPRVSDSAKIAVAARMEVTNLQTEETRRIRPIYLVMQDRSQKSVQSVIKDWKLAVSFNGMNVDSGKAHLKITGAEVPKQDWVVVQASVKPFINVFWLGVLILTGGFVVAMGRRVQDLRFWRRRSS